MLCPSCKTELIVTGQELLETLDEHIFNPNGDPALKDKYECPNQSCPTFKHCCWNEEGDCYTDNWKSKIPFIDNNDAPFGSFNRRINVEIYKKDENKDLFIICRLKFRLVYQYKSDENGNILSRKRKIEIWIKEKNNDSYILYLSGIRMLFFKIRNFHRQIKIYGSKNKKIKEFTDKDNWCNQKEWWRIIGCFYARTYMRFIG